jgi:signal transduction histidine kinase
LSNVARHAKAGAVRVSVRATGGEVVIRIEDDGIGTDPATARGGLVNMDERARDLGGSCTIGPADGHGTVVTWRVPISG